VPQGSQGSSLSSERFFRVARESEEVSNLIFNGMVRNVAGRTSCDYHLDRPHLGKPLENLAEDRSFHTKEEENSGTFGGRLPIYAHSK